MRPTRTTRTKRTTGLLCLPTTREYTGELWPETAVPAATRARRVRGLRADRGPHVGRVEREYARLIERLARLRRRLAPRAKPPVVVRVHEEQVRVCTHAKQSDALVRIRMLRGRCVEWRTIADFLEIRDPSESRAHADALAVRRLLLLRELRHHFLHLREGAQGHRAVARCTSMRARGCGASRFVRGSGRWPLASA